MTTYHYCSCQPNCILKKDSRKMDVAKPLSFDSYAKEIERWTCIYDEPRVCSYIIELNNRELIIHLLQSIKTMIDQFI